MVDIMIIAALLDASKGNNDNEDGLYALIQHTTEKLLSIFQRGILRV
ncbi:MAG: hypothetical protein NZ521_08035 [Flammeovirgaceae bacterium]|nr:hypothetical protein [Flammeovirgaceae bacterium]MDW8286630.1 hypothetical protein [Flammeovirgaceae bacterium]